MNKVSNGTMESKAVKATAQISFPVTPEQLRLIEERCQRYRCSASEVAFAQLLSLVTDSDDEMVWLGVIQASADWKRTGNHPWWDAALIRKQMA